MFDFSTQIKAYREKEGKPTFEAKKVISVFEALSKLGGLLLSGTADPAIVAKALDDVIFSYIPLLAITFPSLTMESASFYEEGPLAKSAIVISALSDFTRYSSSSGKDVPALLQSLKWVLSLEEGDA